MLLIKRLNSLTINLLQPEELEELEEPAAVRKEQPKIPAVRQPIKSKIQQLMRKIHKILSKTIHNNRILNSSKTEETETKHLRQHQKQKIPLLSNLRVLLLIAQIIMVRKLRKILVTIQEPTKLPLMKLRKLLRETLMMQTPAQQLNTKQLPLKMKFLQLRQQQQKTQASHHQVAMSHIMQTTAMAITTVIAKTRIRKIKIIPIKTMPIKL